jgi:hypothetical protein
MRNFKRVVFVCLFILTAKTFAYTPEEGNVSAMTGPIFSRTIFDGPGDRPRSPIMGGVALYAMGDVNDHGTLEIGMVYMNKVFYSDQNNDFLAQQTQLMHISMGYRHWFSHYFSIGSNLYTEYPMGDPETVDRKVGANEPIETSATASAIYGVEFSAQQELWAQDRVAIVLDARYGVNLTNKPGEHADHYMVLFGVRYFIQEKQVVERPKDNPAP